MVMAHLHPWSWKRDEQEPRGDWAESEPGFLRVMVAELDRHKRRMRARPVRVLALAAVLTALVLVRIATKPRLYDASVILAATEGSFNDERGSPLPTKDLHEYVWEGVLNKQVILERVIREHGIELDTLEKFGEDVAIDDVKEPLSVTVMRNYFLYDQRHDSTPRSLRLVIGYQWADPEHAYRMARILANLVVESVQTQRLHEARHAARSARQAMARLTAKLAAEQAELDRLAFELTRAELLQDAGAAAAARVAMKGLTESLADGEIRLATLQGQQRQLDFDVRAEERDMGLSWAVAGEVRPRAVPPPGPIRLAAIGLFCFCVFVPLAAIFFGSFDSKIDDADDVSRLGLPVLGHIPAFTGDQVGSLRRRGALPRRGMLARMGFRDRRPRPDRVA
jgi:hypothetical protein